MEKKYYDDPVIFQNAFYNMESGELINPTNTQNYSIIQVADSYYPSKFYISPHIQCCDIELTLVLKESVVITVGKSDTELLRGEVHVCFKGEEHALLCNQGSRFQTLAFNLTESSSARELLDYLSRKGERVYSTAKLPELFGGIISEFHDTDFAFRLLSLDSLISSILVDLVYPKAKRDSYRSYSPEELTAKVLNYIDKGAAESAGLYDLSGRLGYSYNHIYKIFKKHTGESLQSYLLRSKMERARAMLAENKSVEEVATAVGYSNPYNFSRAFKKFFAVSPGRIEKI